MAIEALPDQRPPVKIRPANGWRLPDVRELWRFRELLWVLGKRDVTLRFRQTIVGPAWIVLGPLLSAGVFSFVFGRVAGLDSQGVPYFAFSYAGLLAWAVFNATVTKSSTSLISNASVVTKVYFPRLILPFASVFSTLTNLVVSAGMMAALMIGYGLPFSPRLLLLPVLLVLLFMLALGLGSILAAGAASYRDVSILTSSLTNLLMYLSPVAYGASTVPDSLRSVYLLNPIATFIELWRWAILGSGTFYAWSVLTSVTIAVAVFLAGIIIFTRIERSFPDVI